jgi:hypothetical protein
VANILGGFYKNKVSICFYLYSCIWSQGENYGYFSGLEKKLPYKNSILVNFLYSPLPIQIYFDEKIPKSTAKTKYCT